MLNTSIFQGPRAQIDRDLYKKHLQEEVFNTPNLQVAAGAVNDLLIEENLTPGGSASRDRCTGVLLGKFSILILQVFTMIKLAGWYSGKLYFLKVWG